MSTHGRATRRENSRLLLKVRLDQRAMSMSQTNRTDSKVPSAKSPSICKHSFRRFAFLTSIRERPVVHQSESIDKHEGRRRSMIERGRRPVRFDEGSLQLFNDPSTTIFRQLNESLRQKSSVNADEEEKAKLCEKFGPDLVEFMTDRHGRIKAKYEKVFII